MIAIFNTIKATVFQTEPVLFDTPKTLAMLAERTHEAAGVGADLVVFPEAFVGGYPKGIEFGARLGMRSPEAERIAEIARTNSVHLVVGVIERDREPSIARP